jgi:hypothetical protein
MNFATTDHVRSRPPLLIGGVGGSGTRVVARIAESLGWFLGQNLNGAHDNLDFPGLSRFRGARRLDPHLTRDELAAFEAKMDVGCCAARNAIGWGWKNPPNYLFLPTFLTRFPTLSYVHVIRHGLDMAFSRNHKQVKKWGHLFGIEYGEPSPERSALRYWAAANDHAIERGRELLGRRFHLLDFERLCDEPNDTISELVAFLGLSTADVSFPALLDMVVPPQSRGRFRHLRASVEFSPEELAHVKRLGFPT